MSRVIIELTLFYISFLLFFFILRIVSLIQMVLPYYLSLRSGACWTFWLSRHKPRYILLHVCGLWRAILWNVWIGMCLFMWNLLELCPKNCHKAMYCWHSKIYISYAYVLIYNWSSPACALAELTWPYWIWQNKTVKYHKSKEIYFKCLKCTVAR